MDDLFPKQTEPAIYQEIEPARAKANGQDRLVGSFLMPDHPSYIADTKENGRRFTYHFGGGVERFILASRHKSKKDGRLLKRQECVPHLAPRSKDYGYTVLDCEGIHHSGREATASCFAADPHKAVHFQLIHGEAELHAFDIIFRNGVDVRQVPWHMRRAWLEEICQENFISKGVRIVPTEYSKTNRAFYEKIVDTGGEGVVLKNIHSPYGQDWWKWKKYHDVSVIVSGYTEAKHGKTGKFDGLIGAVRFSVFDNGSLVEVGQCSGMDDQTREYITRNQKELLGAVMDVRAFEFTGKRLENPRFLLFREDYPAEVCTLAKLKLDLGYEE